MQWILNSHREEAVMTISSIFSPGGSLVKNPPANVGDVGSICGSGTSPGGGNGSRLQYSCLENPTDRGVCQATVQEVAKSHYCVLGSGWWLRFKAEALVLGC